MLKLRQVMVVMALALAIGVGGVAEAKDMSGKFGLGIETALGFSGPAASSNQELHRVPGFSFVYPASELFALQVIGGFAFATGGGGITPAVTIAVGITFRGLYHGLVLSDAVTLVIPFGLGYTVQTYEIGGLGHYLHLESGLRPEWFITDYFSVHTQAGATVSLLLGQESLTPLFYDPGVALDVFGRINLVGKAGFTVWF